MGIKFKAKLGVPLGQQLPSGYTFEETDLRRAMTSWMSQKSRICLLKQPTHSNNIDQRNSCADVIFFNSSSLTVWCQTNNTIMGNHLAEYINKFDYQFEYLPLGFGDSTKNHVSNFEITCIYIRKSA